MFKHVFRSLEPKIFKETLWRGTYFASDHFEMIYGGQKSRKYNIPALISIDWKRYYHFRLQMSGESISLTNKLTILVGQWGWDSWNFVRKVVRMVR
jgi:hypothetical protein